MACGILLASEKQVMREAGHSAFIRIPALDEAATYAKTLEALDPLWKKLYQTLSHNGSLWVIASNSYINGELYPLPLDLAYRVKAITGFKLKNIFVIFREAPMKNKPFSSAYFNILFFVKSLGTYYFDKDAIREPHIFKDIEWGKRSV